MATKAIWCEFCNNKIVPEKNDPPFHFQSRRHGNQKFNYGLLKDKIHNRQKEFDDLEFISYLDQEHNHVNRLEKIFRLSKKPPIKSSNFLFKYEDDKNESDEEEEEEGDRLNNYFMYDEEENKKESTSKNGKIGLDNLGNCLEN